MRLIFSPLTALAAPGGPRSRLSVFYFHRVPLEPDRLLPGEPDARAFDRLLGWIGAQFRVLDPLEACDRLYGGTLPSRPAVVSFDDGYRDNYTVALPILQRHRMQAVFFVSTAFLDGSMMFNDRVIEAVRRCSDDSIALQSVSGEASVRLPLRGDDERRAAIDRLLAAIKHLPPEERLERVQQLERSAGVENVDRRSSPMMMRPEDVRALHLAGMRVGGHTRSHPILLKLDDAQAWSEIDGGLDDLRDICGERPLLFAYPNGRRGADYDERHVSMVDRAGTRYAFTTHPGAATRRAARLELPRFTPWDRSPLRFSARAWLNLVGRVH